MGVVRKIAVEGRAEGSVLDDVVVVRGWLRRYSVEESGVDQLLEEELDIAELVVLDAQGFEHP